MSKHSSPALTMRDALYEAPGPKMRAKIRIGTAISLVAVAALVVLVLQRFYVTGQLSVHYWYFFTHLTTWKFLLAGFEGTVKVALTAGAIALVLGLALMLGRTSDIKPLQLVCRVLTDFFRGVPSLLFIYFFFLVLPQYKIALPSFWMAHASRRARCSRRTCRDFPRRRQRRTARAGRGGPGARSLQG